MLALNSILLYRKNLY